MRRPRIKLRMIVMAFPLAGLIATAAWLVAARIVLRPPSLSEMPSLLAAGRFDEVEAKLRAILELQPDHPQANMLLAQVALARPDQDPHLALEHLRKVRVSHPGARAIVRLNEGKAHSALGRNNLAEDCWLDALRLDPLVPEAGWNLLGLYQVQGRCKEAHRLGMSLFRREPDPHDRAQLLLELLRQDAQPIGADSLIQTFEPLVRDHPDDLYAAIALGRAYIANSRFDEGLSILRSVVDRSWGNPFAWDALLASLDESSRTDELASCLEQLPPAIAGDMRFARYRGTLALQRHDWPGSADWYLQAHRHDPSDLPVLYRLCQSLRVAGRTGELLRYEDRFKTLRAAREQALPLYKETNAVATLGTQPHPDLYHRIADLRERMGRPDEALAWHRLVLADRDDDPISRSAVERLAAENTDESHQEAQLQPRR
jgi:tetratricopeptide (TPR) repeat protein